MLARRLARPVAACALFGMKSALPGGGGGPAQSDADGSRAQAIASSHADRLATSDGKKYTLDYLDRSTRFSVWRGNGERSSFSELMAAAAAHDVILLGETHYDAIAHKLQEIIFARLSAARPVVLSLEMFETDVQHVLDEYLNGLTREQDLLNDARPWANYKAAYRPMVELAKVAVERRGW